MVTSACSSVGSSSTATARSRASAAWRSDSSIRRSYKYVAPRLASSRARIRRVSRLSGAASSASSPSRRRATRTSRLSPSRCRTATSGPSNAAASATAPPARYRSRALAYATDAVTLSSLAAAAAANSPSARACSRGGRSRGRLRSARPNSSNASRFEEIADAERAPARAVRNASSRRAARSYW